MKELKADSHREAIELYLVSEEGKVILTDKQKELKTRWEYADELIRKNEMRRETIAQMIIRKFGVSRATAFQDIVNAEGVFSSSTPINKRYAVGNRIEFLQMKINELYGQVEGKPEMEEDEPEDPFAQIARIGQNEEYINQAIALEKVLAKYYEMYPDIVPKRSPKIIQYNITQINNAAPSEGIPASGADLFNKARQILQIKEKHTDGELPE